MKKIALVYDAIYPYIKGGGEKRFYDIGQRLSKKGYEVHFYGMKFWKGASVIKKEGMYYHALSKEIPLYNNKKRTISQALSFGLSSFKLLKEDFDIIDCCGFPYFSLFPAKLACILKGKPLYSTWHEVWGKKYWLSYLGKKGILGYLVEKLASKLPTKIIAISPHTKGKLISQLKVPAKKISVIGIGTDISKIKKIPLSKEASDVIYAGRLLSHKNIDILIKSIFIIKKSNPKIKCIIVGDGPEMSSLKSLASSLNLNKNISFKGFIEKIEDVYSLMKSSKVFVLPSTREGFGIVTIEANACGLPVLTVNHPDNGSKDLIIDNKNGLVCPLTEKALADNINNIINPNKSNNSMKKGCENQAKEYDWNNVINQLEEVYQK